MVQALGPFDHAKDARKKTHYFRLRRSRKGMFLKYAFLVLDFGLQSFKMSVKILGFPLWCFKISPSSILPYGASKSPPRLRRERVRSKYLRAFGAGTVV